MMAFQLTSSTDDAAVFRICVQIKYLENVLLSQITRVT